MKIEIIKPTDDFLIEKGVKSWGIWEKETSQFPWFYDAEEHCYILEGKVIVNTDFEQVTIEAGDYVIFPKGLDCHWNILSPIRKHFNFL